MQIGNYKRSSGPTEVNKTYSYLFINIDSQFLFIIKIMLLLQNMQFILDLIIFNTDIEKRNFLIPPL